MAGWGERTGNGPGATRGLGDLFSYEGVYDLTCVGGTPRRELREWVRPPAGPAQCESGDLQRAGGIYTP